MQAVKSPLILTLDHLKAARAGVAELLLRVEALNELFLVTCYEQAPKDWEELKELLEDHLERLEDAIEKNRSIPWSAPTNEDLQLHKAALHTYIDTVTASLGALLEKIPALPDSYKAVLQNRVDAVEAILNNPPMQAVELAGKWQEVVKLPGSWTKEIKQSAG